MNKTIIFYLGHPAHYHNISNVLPALEKSGNKVILFARGKDVLFDLISHLSFQKKLISDHRKKNTTFSLIKSVLKREIQFYMLAKKHHANMLIGTDIVVTHIGRLLNIPSLVLNEDDSTAVPLLAKYGFKFSSWTLSPVCCDIHPYNHKKIGYNSYHELGYLHPKYFKPDIRILAKYVPVDSTFFLIRFAKLSAHHDKGVKGISNEIALKIIEMLKPFGRVILSSEREISTELEEFRLKIHPLHMHHIMAFAQMYIGDSQTMAAEAGVLGTPFIRFNDFVGRLGYLKELEDHYGLGFGIKTNNIDKLFSTIKKILENPKIQEDMQQKRNKMLSDKIDFAAFLTWFIENYPDSSKIMRINSDFQYKFK